MSGKKTATADAQYTNRLLGIEQSWWRRYLDPQIPYRYNLQRLNPGWMLDIGCGLGRNLINNRGCGVGVDHNPASVGVCRTRGLEAYTPADFLQSKHRHGTFDSLLLAHVAEHMTAVEGAALIKSYLPYLKRGGKVIVITPQEAGYASDETHVEFMDFYKVEALLKSSGVTVTKRYSFPLPRWVGTFFKHNEFVVTGTVGY